MRVTLVLGQSQQGKTTLALKMLRERSRRLLVLDPVRSTPFQEILRQPGALAFPSWAALRSFLVTASGPWVAVLQSPHDSDYAAALRAAPYYRHVTILADEALWFTGVDVCYDALVKVSRANAHFGGGIGVPLWVTAQRPMDLPPDIRSQATQIISFRQDEPGDLTFLSKKCSPSFAGEVAALGKHQWAAYPPLNGKGVPDAHVQAAPLGNGGSTGVAGDFQAGPAGERDSVRSNADRGE